MSLWPSGAAVEPCVRQLSSLPSQSPFPRLHVPLPWLVWSLDSHPSHRPLAAQSKDDIADLDEDSVQGARSS